MGRHRITADVVHCSGPADIPVYPVFGIMKRKLSLTDNPYICEDDNGRIAFVSQEARRNYMRKLYRKCRSKEEEHNEQTLQGCYRKK